MTENQISSDGKTLKSVIDICDELNLNYMAYQVLLLGDVKRHKLST